MRSVLLAAWIAQGALLIALTGCVTAASPVGAGASMDAVRAFAVAESGFDAAVETADAAVRSGTLSVTTMARIKALADTGHAYVVAGRAAVRAAGDDDLLSETAALTALVAQLAALSKG